MKQTITDWQGNAHYSESVMQERNVSDSAANASRLSKVSEKRERKSKKERMLI
jgi:hypothetical protein